MTTRWWRPPLSLPLVAVAAAAFAAARLRRARALHPRGRSFGGRLLVGGGHRLGVRLFDVPAEYRVTARLSRGVPTPEGWPDVFGLAVRVHGAYPGRDVDLLMSSAGLRPGLRHLVLPRRGLAGGYASLAGYRAGRHRLYLAAWPERPAGGRGGSGGSGEWGSVPGRLGELEDAARGDGVRFVLAVAGRRAPWRPFGRLVLDEPLGPAADARLAFDPDANDAPDLEAVGWFQRLRGVAYRGSQRGRGVAAAQHGPVGQPEWG